MPASRQALDAGAATTGSAIRYCPDPATGREAVLLTLSRMATQTSTHRIHQHGAPRARHSPEGFGPLALALHLLAAAVSRGHSQRSVAGKTETVEEPDEAVWPATLPKKSEQPAPGDWLFPSFFLCMAVAALPLIGTRWTTAGMATWRAVEEVVLLALPVIIPLPFLFAACVVALAFHPASRTPAAFGFLCLAMAIGLAALHALAV